jgi:hypothetical protein
VVFTLLVFCKSVKTRLSVRFIIVLICTIKSSYKSATRSRRFSRNRTTVVIIEVLYKVVDFYSSRRIVLNLLGNYKVIGRGISRIDSSNSYSKVK